MRKEGFYWVKLREGRKQWQIAYYSRTDNLGSWSLTGSDWIFFDQCFEEIDENILQKA